MKIRVTTQTVSHTTTLGQFLSDNPDLDPEEIDLLDRALINGRPYAFGGGAAPVICVEREADPDISDEDKRKAEQQILVNLSDDLSLIGKIYEDRDEFGSISFLVAPDTPESREFVEDTPATYEVRGKSLIITASHP